MQSWKYNENKKLYLYGGIALGSLLVYASSWLLKKFKSVKVSPWLEEYFSDIKDQYKELKNKKLTAEFIGSVMNLSTELQTYLFANDHADLENDRVKNINNEKVYEELVAESVELHEKYYMASSDLIKSKTGIDMGELGQSLSTYDQKEIKDATKTQRKDYYDSELPLIEKDKLKEAYILYAKTYTQHARISSEQMVLAQRKPEYQEIAFKTIFQNKFLLKDMIKSKYGIDTKYLEQLLKKHELLDDNEVRYYYEDVKRSVTI